MNHFKKILTAAAAFLCLSTGVMAREPAILMVHYGTTVDDTRTKTIDALNADVKAAFPRMTVEEAYTSPVVIRKLAERGIVKKSVTDALLQLAAAGVKEVTVQPSTVLPGTEYDGMVRAVDYMKPFFKSVRIGSPLIASVADCRNVCDILSRTYSAELAVKKGGMVFVGHGTPAPAGATYSQIDYMLTGAGHTNATVITVEGYPEAADGLARMKEAKVRSVTIAPIMLTAGGHMAHDIDGHIAELFRNAGIEVTTIARGLGEIPAIRAMYIDHIRQAMK